MHIMRPMNVLIKRFGCGCNAWHREARREQRVQLEGMVKKLQLARSTQQELIQVK